MTPKTDVTPSSEMPPKKPRLALAIATALGVGYIPKAPGTFGSLVGVATAYLSAVFFLRPTSFGGVLPPSVARRAFEHQRFSRRLRVVAAADGEATRDVSVWRQSWRSGAGRDTVRPAHAPSRRPGSDPAPPCDR